MFRCTCVHFLYPSIPDGQIRYIPYQRNWNKNLEEMLTLSCSSQQCSQKPISKTQRNGQNRTSFPMHTQLWANVKFSWLTFPSGYEIQTYLHGTYGQKCKMNRIEMNVSVIAIVWWNQCHSQCEWDADCCETASSSFTGPCCPLWHGVKFSGFSVFLPLYILILTSCCEGYRFIWNEFRKHLLWSFSLAF